MNYSINNMWNQFYQKLIYQIMLYKQKMTLQKILDINCFKIAPMVQKQKQKQIGSQTEKNTIGKSFATLLYKCLQKWAQKFENQQDSEFYLIYQELKNKLNFSLASLVEENQQKKSNINQSQSQIVENNQPKNSNIYQSPQKNQNQIEQQIPDETTNKKLNSETKIDQKQEPQKIQENKSQVVQEEDQIIKLQTIQNRIKTINNNFIKIIKPNNEQKFLKYYKQVKDQYVNISQEMQNLSVKIKDELYNQEFDFVKKQMIPLIETYESQKVFPDIVKQGYYYIKQYSKQNQQLTDSALLQESQVRDVENLAQQQQPIQNKNDQNKDIQNDKKNQNQQDLQVQQQEQSLKQQQQNQDKQQSSIQQKPPQTVQQIQEIPQNQPSQTNQQKQDIPQSMFVKATLQFQDSNSQDFQQQKLSEYDDQQTKQPRQQENKQKNQQIKPQQQKNQNQSLDFNSFREQNSNVPSLFKDILNDQQQGKQTSNKYGEIKKRVRSPLDGTKEKTYQSSFFLPSKNQNNISLSKQIENLQLENQTLKNNLDVIRSQKNQFIQKNFALKNQNEETQKTLLKQEEQLKIQEEKLNQIQEEERQKAQEQIESKEQDIIKLQKTNEENEKRMLKELQKIQAQNDEEFNKINDELDQEHLKNERLLESNEKLQKDKLQKQNEIEVLKQKLNNLQQDLDKKHLELGEKDRIFQSSEYKTLQIDCDNFKNELDSIQKINQELIQKNNTLREQVINYQNQINRKHEELTQKKEIQEKLLQQTSEEKQSKDEEIQKLKLTTEEKQKIAESKDEEIQKMEQEIKLKDSLLINFEKDCKILQEQNIDLQQNIEYLENQNQEIQNQYDDLQKDYKELKENFDLVNQELGLRNQNQQFHRPSTSDEQKRKKKIFEPFRPPHKSLIEIDPNLSKSFSKQLMPKNTNKSNDNQDNNNSEGQILADLTPKKKDVIIPLKLSDFINLQKESGENWMTSLDMQSPQQIQEQQGNIYRPEIFDSTVSSNDSFINNNIKNMVQDIKAYQSIEAELIYPFDTASQYFQNKASHEPKGKLIANNPKVLENLIKDPIQRIRFKKSCLKNKSQIYLNDSLQIGVITDLQVNQNECAQIISMFFKNVGSQVIQSFQVEYIYQQDIIEIYEQPQSLFTSIQVEDQIRQDLMIELKSIPYQISLCQILYKIGGFSKKIVFPLPSTINKLTEQSSLTLNEFRTSWKEAKISLIRSEKFYLDTEIVNNAYHFLHYFPYFLEVNQNKAENYKMGLSENRIGGYLYLRQTGTAILMKIIVYPDAQAVFQICFLNEEDTFFHQNAIIQLLNTYVLIFGKSK